MTDQEFRARLPADMLARLDAGDLRREDLPILKPLLREALAGPGPARWYRNPTGRHLWHISDRLIIPGVFTWTACGNPVQLEAPGLPEPPPDAVVCQRCRKTRLATGLVPAGRWRRMRQARRPGG